VTAEYLLILLIFPATKDIVGPVDVTNKLCLLEGWYDPDSSDSKVGQERKFGNYLAIFAKTLCHKMWAEKFWRFLRRYCATRWGRRNFGDFFYEN
jgi:hypothetical protein